jgi:CRP-like cAMP-binding protein
MIKDSELRIFDSLSHMNDRSRNALAGVLTRRSYSDGEIILRQGQPGDGMHLLLRGHVRVTRQLPTRRTVGLVTLGPGALFGALASMDGRRGAADCMSWGTVHTAFLGLSEFNALMEGNTPFALQFQVVILHTLFEDIRHTNRRLAELSTLPELDLAAAGDVITGLA